MNLAQISYFYQPVRGGQEVYIQTLQEILRKQGWDSKVYQPNWGKSASDAILVPRIPLIGRVIPYSAHHLFNWTLRLFYRQQLRKNQVVLVHYAFFTVPVWDYQNRTIVKSHGIEWNPGGAGSYDRYCERVAQESFDRFTIVANDTHYLRHFGLKVEPGESLYQQIAPGKWFIPNCVDTHLFTQKAGLDELKRQKIILVPRQITPDRGIDLAIRAFFLFDQRERGYSMLLLGPVPKSGIKYAAECQNLIRKLQLENRVKFASAVSNKEMPIYYSSAQLTLIPSLRREGTSLSALESMACKTPVVSTDIAGLKDLPTLKAQPTPQSIAEKLQQAVDNRTELAKQQAGMVSDHFNLRNWENAWVRVIESVLET
jgi:glycosyltransferase involved in cell wall biosynthesis